MKNRILVCAISAALGIIIDLSPACGTVSHNMSASVWGEEGAKVLIEIDRQKSTIDPDVMGIFNESFEDFDQLVLQFGWDVAHNFERFSNYFARRLLKADIPYTKRFRRHVQKHNFLILSQFTEQYIKTGYFYGAGRKFKRTFNSAVVWSDSADDDVLSFLFLRGKPLLKFDANSGISFVLTNRFLLGELDMKNFGLMLFVYKEKRVNSYPQASYL